MDTGTRDAADLAGDGIHAAATEVFERWFPLNEVSSSDDGRTPGEPTRARIESRLAELRSEYDKGQSQLQRLQAQLTDLQQTMLRLSGAITILEELLAPSGATSPDSDHSPMSARIVQPH
jgi:uncharacterized coiled-coil protein SlyX